MTQWFGELSVKVLSRNDSVTWRAPSKSTGQEWLSDLVSSKEQYWAGLTEWLSVIVISRNDSLTWSAFSNSTRQEWLSDMMSSQSQRWAGMTQTLQSLPNGMEDRSSIPRTSNDFSKISIFWDVTSRWWLNAFCHFEGTCCSHLEVITVHGPPNRRDPLLSDAMSHPKRPESLWKYENSPTQAVCYMRPLPPGKKTPRRETDLAHPSVSMNENAWSYTFTSPHVFMVWRSLNTNTNTVAKALRWIACAVLFVVWLLGAVTRKTQDTISYHQQVHKDNGHLYRAGYQNGSTEEPRGLTTEQMPSRSPMHWKAWPWRRRHYVPPKKHPLTLHSSRTNWFI